MGYMLPATNAPTMSARDLETGWRTLDEKVNAGSRGSIRGGESSSRWCFWLCGNICKSISNCHD